MRWPWRALNVATPTLALLVALVSVVGQTAPHVLPYVVRPRPDDVVSRLVAVEPDRRTVNLVFFNLGEQPAAIRSVRLELPTDVAARGGAFRLGFDLEGSSRLVAPGGSLELIATSRDALPTTPRPTSKNAVCKLVVEIIRFDGSVKADEMLIELGF